MVRGLLASLVVLIAAAERPRRTRTKQVCPYEVAGDRWVCPSPQLGLELLAGNDGVQPIVGTP